MISTKFNNEKQVLETTWTGDIYLNEIIAYIDATRLNETYPRILKILTDSTQANFILEPDDLQIIVEANLKSLENYTYIIDAMVLKDPHDTAISFLYKKVSATKKYFFEIFSTRSAGFDWLANYLF